MDHATAEDDGEAVDRLNRDWEERPFARTFDLISAEYGWTDEQILDLTLARMRQIREVIGIRQSVDLRSRVRLEEAKVQQLVAATHAAAGNKKGAKAASAIRFLPDTEEERKAKVISTAEATRVFGVDPAFGLFDEDDIEREMERLNADPEFRAMVERMRED